MICINLNCKKKQIKVFVKFDKMWCLKESSNGLRGTYSQQNLGKIKAGLAYLIQVSFDHWTNRRLNVLFSSLLHCFGLYLKYPSKLCMFRGKLWSEQAGPWMCGLEGCILVFSFTLLSLLSGYQDIKSLSLSPPIIPL